MNDDGESAERRPSLDVSDQIWRDLDSLFGRPEDEVARVENELLALGNVGLSDVLRHLVLAVGMNTRDVRPLELEKLRAETEVDTRRLDLHVDVVERFDDEVALVQTREQVRIGENHTGMPVTGGFSFSCRRRGTERVVDLSEGVPTRVECNTYFSPHTLNRTVTDGPPERIHVLHVDDDPDFLALVKQFLERVDEELRVIPVEGVPAALDRLRRDDRIECVLSDYDMPTVDGLDFLARVRDVAPRLPFLLYTGQGDEAVAAAAISAGVNDYIQKGARTTHYLKLSVRIKREVERRRAERETETRLAALEAARDGICILDADGRVEYANAAYLDLYGYEHSDLVGTPWERLHPESEVEFITAEVLPHLDEHGEWTGESVGRRADGTTFPESKSMAALPDDKLVIVATAFTDSTAT